MMNLKFERVFLRLLLILTAVIAIPGLAFAGPAGKFTIVRGAVDLLKAGSASAISVKVGDEVSVGDIVRTKSESRAQVALADGSVLNIVEKSRIEIKEFAFDSEKGTRNGLFRTLRGGLRSIVSKMTSGGSSRFEVETPTAVAAVRGTDFLVSVGGLSVSTDVLVYAGHVAVRNINPKVKGEVVLGPGQSTRVGTGQPPSSPQNLKPEELSPETGAGKEKERRDIVKDESIERIAYGIPEMTPPLARTNDSPRADFYAPEIFRSVTNGGLPNVISEPHPELLKTPVTVNVQF